MQDHPFREARLKIERAKKHIGDLNRILETATNRQTHLVFIEHDTESGDDFLKVKGTESLGDEFALTLGDALHNLRTSLDYTMNEIEFATTGKRTTFTKFPIYPTRDGFVSAANGALKEKAPKQVIDCLRDTVQPYKGGNGHALWCLHEIDIEDKHRLLITNVELKLVRDISLEDERGKELLLDPWLIVPGKIAERQLPADSHFKVKNQGRATYRVAFSPKSAFAGRDIVPALSSLVKLIEATISEVEHSFRLSQM